MGGEEVGGGGEGGFGLVWKFIYCPVSRSSPPEREAGRGDGMRCSNLWEVAQAHRPSHHSDLTIEGLLTSPSGWLQADGTCEANGATRRAYGWHSERTRPEPQTQASRGDGDAMRNLRSRKHIPEPPPDRTGTGRDCGALCRPSSKPIRQCKHGRAEA